MLKTAITLAVLSLTSFAFTQTSFEIEDPCNSKKPFLTTTINESNISLGKLTVDILNKNNIPFKGSKDGIVSIMNSLAGDDALIIINDYEMYAFGWCFQIDGVLAEYMPDDVQISSDVKKIRWYYAYAHYLRGQWITQCGEKRRIIQENICN